ncbi:hypothetical protein [Actinomadura bangladeshensis]|uniref:Uncharacterized protein n=1 Tax=Actinomadura bangladeshensis TaxID=453573 RepID=A0A6L9QBH6_9ACTN|nr:hypothetical protein [Actinomadura bangladeshensis]NEA22605.1 hypothetical protein [Actinomadura bangladeshensis]
MSIMQLDMPDAEPRGPEPVGIAALSPEQLAGDEDAARLARDLARTGDGGMEPVRVAAFNSFIG